MSSKQINKLQPVVATVVAQAEVIIRRLVGAVHVCIWLYVQLRVLQRLHLSRSVSVRAICGR